MESFRNALQFIFTQLMVFVNFIVSLFHLNPKLEAEKRLLSKLQTMENNEREADQLIAEAEKQGGSPKNVDEAIKSYQQAAKLYASGSKALRWSKAASALSKAAALHEKAGRKDKEASNYVNAAKYYMVYQPDEAVSHLIKAIEIYIDMGSFSNAAWYHRKIAEMYEEDLDDRAIHHYEQAAYYYKLTESERFYASRCLSKAAQYYAVKNKDYKKAIEIFEELGSDSLRSDYSSRDYLLSEKEYLLPASLCQFCMDIRNAKEALGYFEKNIQRFQDCREFVFVETLIGHIEYKNVDGFDETVREYDSVSKLGYWLTLILQRIKTQVGN